MGFRFASAVVRSALAATKQVKLSDSVPRELVDDIFSSAIKKQTGVSLRYMLDFGANPIKRQMVLSAQFLHNELPVRLAHRVAELENLPYGLSAKPQVLRVCCLLYDIFATSHCSQLNGQAAYYTHVVFVCRSETGMWSPSKTLESSLQLEMTMMSRNSQSS